MPQYYAVIKPHRRDFLTNPNSEEQEIMEKHFRYLKELLLKEKLILAGPTLVKTDPFGIYIFETEAEKEARDLLENDPAVMAGVQIIDDFRPIRVSLLKGMTFNEKQ